MPGPPFDWGSGRLEADGRAVSIWLRPCAEQTAELAAVIDGLASDLGTPTFPPHVTVVGDGSVVGSCDLERWLAEVGVHRPLDLPIISVQHTAAYHRCVFFECAAPSSLLALRDACRRVVRDEEARSYLPHLSAVYGHLSSPEREEVATGLRAMIPLDLHLDTLSCWDTTGDDPRVWTELFAPISLHV